MYRLAGAAVITAAIAASGLIAPTAARAETGVSVSFSYFQSNLSPHGRWFSHPRYGRSWRPNGVAAGWRPYTNGRWEWTEEYGWTWASYYNWGWAPFHYGRWVYDSQNDWYWVPGYEWGPAWVAWRNGGGFIGWYPLPPEAVWRPGVGIVYSGSGIYGASYNPRWVFVAERQFLSVRISNVLVRSQDNARFIRNTRHSTNYGGVNNRVVNRGLATSYIGRVTGKRVVAIKPRVVTGRGDWRAPTPGSREVHIFRPPAVERVDWRIRVAHAGTTIVDAPYAMRMLETSQAPAYYVAGEFVDLDHLVASAHRTGCEWKGRAAYADVVAFGDV